MATISTGLTDQEVNPFFTKVKTLLEITGIPYALSGNYRKATSAELRFRKAFTGTSFVNPDDNTDYILTNIGELELFCDLSYDVWVKISFRSSGGSVGLTINDGWTFVGGSPEDVAPGDIWELSLKEGICVMVKMGSTL